MAKRGRITRKAKRGQDPQREHDRNYRLRHPLRILLKHAKRRVKRAGVEFDLLESDFDLPLPTHCPILQIPLRYGGNGGSRQSDNSATIDRIDNDQGYVRGNAIIVSWKANRMKSDATAEELLTLGNFYKRGQTSNALLYFTTTIPQAPLQENELCDFYWKANPNKLQIIYNCFPIDILPQIVHPIFRRRCGGQGIFYRKLVLIVPASPRQHSKQKGNGNE